MQLLPEPAGPRDASEPLAVDGDTGADSGVGDLGPVDEALPTQAPPFPEDDGGDKGTRIYALALSELQGLGPDIAPGTRLELWVSWNPPVTEEPKVQHLFRGAIVYGLTPPVTPDGPVTIELALDEKKVPDLIYADRFGAITATELP